jgi:aurora kinase A
MAPEMIKNQPHNFSLDIWCLGILLYELLHGKPPYGGKNDQDKCKQILNKKVE